MTEKDLQQVIDGILNIVGEQERKVNHLSTMDLKRLRDLSSDLNRACALRIGEIIERKKEGDPE